MHCAGENGHGLAAEPHPFSVERASHPAAALGGLKADERLLAKALRPERREGAVRRPGDWVFVDAKRGAEKPRNEFGVIASGLGGDDHTARVELGQVREIRLEAKHGWLVGDLHEVVEPVLAAPQQLRAERLGQAAGRIAWRGWFGGEIQQDGVARLAGGEFAAAGLEHRRVALGQAAGLPQRMRGGEGGVAAQVDLGDWREPPQPEAVAAGPGERRLGQVHLGGDLLHPAGWRLGGGQADGGWVAGERLGGKGVNLEEWDARLAWHGANVRRAREAGKPYCELVSRCGWRHGLPR